MTSQNVAHFFLFSFKNETYNKILKPYPLLDFLSLKAVPSFLDDPYNIPLYNRGGQTFLFFGLNFNQKFRKGPQSFENHILNFLNHFFVLFCHFDAYSKKKMDTNLVNVVYLISN